MVLSVYFLLELILGSVQVREKNGLAVVKRPIGLRQPREEPGVPFVMKSCTTLLGSLLLRGAMPRFAPFTFKASRQPD